MSADRWGSPRSAMAIAFGHVLRCLLGALMVFAAAPAQAQRPQRVEHAEALPWAPDRAEQAAAGPGRWERELRRREAVLATHRGRASAAILGLLGVLEDVEGEVAPRRIERFVSKVSEDRGRHPLVRAYAAYLSARLLESAGDLVGAKQRLQSQGYMVAWQIVGPFDNTGRKGEQAVYAPQTEPYAADQVFTGKLPSESLSWRLRDYESIPRNAYVSFDDLLRPNRQVTGYATSWVWVPDATPAAVHLGTGGPYEIWVDGESVGSGDAYRMPHPLQESHPLHLAIGWNRILIKVSAIDGMWGFYARVSTPTGAPIAALRMQAEPPSRSASEQKDSGTSRAQAAKATAAPNVASLREALETRAGDSHGKQALDQVEFYRYTRPFDQDDSTAIALARAVDGRLRSSRSAWLRAVIASDQSESLQALRKGIERAHKEGPRSRILLAQMLLELGWRQRSLGMEERYRELVGQAREAAPDDAVVELALIDQAVEQGFGWLGLRWLEDLVRRYPESETLRAELATRTHLQGRTSDALAMLEELAKMRGGTRAVVGQRIELLLDLGRADAATQLALTAADAAPGLPEVHQNVARLEEARGDAGAARGALARAIGLAPHDADLHAELGRLLARTGAAQPAVASLERSLQLRPQQPEVRDLLASIDRRSSKDLFARHGVSLEKIGKTPTPRAWRGKEAGVLHHRVAVKVLPNGLTERLDHRIIRILDDRGIRSQAVQGLSYDPAESIVQVRRARVRRKNGTIEELGDVQVTALASAGFRMYYDQRRVQVGFGGLRVGDTLEVAFLQRDIAARNMFDEYFGDIMLVQGMEPRRHVEYILEAPEGKPIYFNLPVKKTPSKAGTSVVYRYEAKDVPGIKPEPGMPGWTEIATYLHASTYKTWTDVGDWYYDLVREQLVVNEDVRAAVQTALAGLPAGADARAKVDAIYEYVVRNTRYVGLEFGIHGYKPYSTTEVLQRRFGDCKDKASLLKVMLEEAGIGAHLVLVRTRDQGTVPALPASLAVFNHAITYVPSLDLFLDGTAEWSGSSELPANDQGASVLVVRDGKGAKFLTTPVSAAGENLRAIEQTIDLATEGAATMQHRITVQGASAGAVRFRFQSPEQRKERATDMLGSLYPGAAVQDVETPGIGNIKQPAQLSAKIRAPNFGTIDGDRLRFPVLGRGSSMMQGLAGLAERKHDLMLDVPSTETYHLRYDLPRGHRFSRVPSAAKIATELGTFELKIATTPDGAEVHSRLQLLRHRIEPSEYRAFREFLRRVDATLEQTFEVAPAR